MARGKEEILKDTDDLAEAEARAITRIQTEKQGTSAAAWRIYIWRLAGPEKKKDGSENRLTELAIDDLEGLPDFLKQEYGDGLYRIRVRNAGRNVEQWDLNIELSPAERSAFRQKVRAFEAAQMPAVMAAPPAAGNMGELAGALADAMRYQTDTLARVIESMKPAGGPPVDPMAAFAATMAAFKSFQEALPRTEQATGVSMFEKGFSLAEKLTARVAEAGGESETSLLDLLKSVLGNPEVISGLRAMAQANARAPMMRRLGQARPGPGPRQAPPPQGPAAAPRPAEAPIGDPSARAIEYLIAQAKMGAQPELVADTALQLIPSDRLDQLDQLAPAAALDLLISYYPEAAPYRAWFGALLNAMYEPETEADNVARGEPGAGADLAPGAE